MRLAGVGASVSLIVLTDGDKGYYPFIEPSVLAEIRRREQDRAATLWNAARTVYLGYPDGRVEVTAGLVARLADEIKRADPQYVLSFDGDYPLRLSHRDHVYTGVATREALIEARSGAWLLRFATRAANFAVDVTAQRHRKLDLLRVHRSQFHGERLRVAARIVARTAREHGALMGVRYAEAFRCSRPHP